MIKLFLLIDYSFEESLKSLAGALDDDDHDNDNEDNHNDDDDDDNDDDDNDSSMTSVSPWRVFIWGVLRLLIVAKDDDDADDNGGGGGGGIGWPQRWWWRGSRTMQNLACLCWSLDKFLCI